MEDKIQNIKDSVAGFPVNSKDDLENFRIRFLGKKGELQDLFQLLKAAPAEEKRELGQKINEVKSLIEEKYEQLKSEFEEKSIQQKGLSVDLTLDPAPVTLGSRHPVSITRKRIVEIMERIGFNISEGPEIVDDWHNFTALNTPADHPARDMQDTFYISVNPEILLRTQTSSVQVKVMESQAPPIRTISPGRVYRNETISARSHCQFHQVEGLYIDENVTFADLKQTLYYFVQEFFGVGTDVRFRPSYFPFTEPSAEMDITCLICHGEGCPVCKQSGWVEILGCGMVDPQVLINCKIDPVKYSGYAFGMGIERITQLKYRINDIRLFYDNDIRFLSQFKSEY
jgi:phenylalanyl-tRNA synthetase alpha chain